MITQDPRSLFMDGCRRAAMAHLLYGIWEHSGFVQLTGEVGTSKITLCRARLEQLPPEVNVAFLWNPCLTGVDQHSQRRPGRNSPLYKSGND